jgi:hypothetical protein
MGKLLRLQHYHNTFYNNTTVQAAQSTLYARGEISPLFQDNMLLWRRVEKG